MLTLGVSAVTAMPRERRRHGERCRAGTETAAAQDPDRCDQLRHAWPLVRSRPGDTLFYIDETARYLFVGRLYDMEERRDVTAARLLELNPDLLAAGAARVASDAPAGRDEAPVQAAASMSTSRRFLLQARSTGATPRANAWSSSRFPVRVLPAPDWANSPRPRSMSKSDRSRSSARQAARFPRRCCAPRIRQRHSMQPTPARLRRPARPARTPRRSMPTKPSRKPTGLPELRSSCAPAMGRCFMATAMPRRSAASSPKGKGEPQ